MIGRIVASYAAMLEEQKRRRRKCKRTYLYRSARTGKFVSASYAKRYPSITVRETKCSSG